MVVVPQHVKLNINAILARTEQGVLTHQIILKCALFLSLFVGETYLFENRSYFRIAAILLNGLHVSVNVAILFLLEEINLQGANLRR